MSIEQKTIVDAIGIEDSTGSIVLTIIEPLE
ncbi:MAG: hypothetical protein ACI8WB_002343 [Phenylobacterium sp.]|jgi:hypothetical protein